MPKSNFVLSKAQRDIERLAELKAELSALQEVHDRLETRLRRRLGRQTGVNHVLNVYDSVAKTFNYTRAQRLLGAEAYSRCWKSTPYRTSRITKIISG